MMNFQVYKSKLERKNRKRFISVEQEILTCNKEGNSVDCRALFGYLKKHKNFKSIIEKGELRGLENKEFQVLRAAGIESLEIVLKKPQENITKIAKKYYSLMNVLVNIANKLDIYLIGQGLPPKSTITKYSDLEDRYKLLKRRSSNKEAVMQAVSTASNQITIDVREEEIVDALNIFNGLSGFFIACFANSAISNNKLLGSLCKRQVIWKKVGVNFVFMPPYFDSLKDYFDFICDQKVACLEKNNFGSHERSIRFDCRYRKGFRSVEIRMACQQFPQESMVVAAFTFGLIENIQKVKKILNNFTSRELLNVKKKAIKSGMRDFTKKERKYLKLILSYSKEGLKKRDLGEEIFIKSLKERIKISVSPADIAVLFFENGGAEELVEKSSWNYFLENIKERKSYKNLDSECLLVDSYRKNIRNYSFS